MKDFGAKALEFFKIELGVARETLFRSNVAASSSRARHGATGSDVPSLARSELIAIASTFISSRMLAMLSVLRRLLIQAGRADEKGKVRELWCGFVSNGFPYLNLHGGVRDVILAADDVRDAEIHIVDDRAERVKRHAVSRTSTGSDSEEAGKLLCFWIASSHTTSV